MKKLLNGFFYEHKHLFQLTCFYYFQTLISVCPFFTEELSNEPLLTIPIVINFLSVILLIGNI